MAFTDISRNSLYILKGNLAKHRSISFHIHLCLKLGVKYTK